MSEQLSCMTKLRGGSATKHKLSAVGLKLFATHGYHLTKIADIVTECGLTQASFYLYYETKLELALELIAYGRGEMLSAVKRGYRASPATPRDMLANSRTWIKDLLIFSRENRYFMAFLLARGHGADPEIDRAIADTRHAVYLALRQNISRATELGMLPKGRATDLRAAFVHRLIEGSIEWWLFGHGYDLDHKPPVSAEVLATDLVRFEFLGLIGSEPPPAGLAGPAGRSKSKGTRH